MKTSLLGAAFLFSGAGAAMVAALEPDGDNIALFGSDGLYDVSLQVVAACPNLATHAISYQGHGSVAGAGQMVNHAQRIAPMGQALTSPQYCLGSGTAFTAGARPGLAEDLLLGIESLAVVADQVTTCATTHANGLGTVAPFQVFADGASGTPASCPGCDASNTYTFTDSLDALKVLYFGLTHDGSYDCGGSVRRSLIRTWGNLFADTTCAGGSTCATGLTHAFRGGDLTGAADAFVGLLGPLPPKPGLGLGADGKPGTVGIGTPSNVIVGAINKMNPFCNAVDANSAPPTLSYGGANDFIDKDPIRIPCGISGTVEDVCGPGQGNHRGDLGVVLPIVLPDATSTTANDLYQSVDCSTTCGLVAPFRLSQIPSNFRCADGSLPLAGLCYTPVTSTGDARCKSAFSTRCVSATGRPDGRAYNLVNIVAASQVPISRRGTTPYQWAIDVNNRLLNGAFYRIHQSSAGVHNVPDPAAGTTGTCRQADATAQIGCLVDADPCSVGYADRRAARTFPGLGAPPTPSPAPFKALAINGVPPFSPGADPELAIKNLLAPPGTTPLYPLARRAYLATIYGFGAPPSPTDGSGLQGGEKLLADCFGDNNIVGPAMASYGFTPIPGGIQCLDYPEESASTTGPANLQGPGNVGLPGCGLGGSGQNACQVSPPTITN